MAAAIHKRCTANPAPNKIKTSNNARINTIEQPFSLRNSPQLEDPPSTLNRLDEQRSPAHRPQWCASDECSPLTMTMIETTAPMTPTIINIQPTLLMLKPCWYGSVTAQSRMAPTAKAMMLTTSPPALIIGAPFLRCNRSTRAKGSPNSFARNVRIYGGLFRERGCRGRFPSTLTVPRVPGTPSPVREKTSRPRGRGRSIAPRLVTRVEGNRLMSRIASGHALLPRTPSPERPRRLWKVALEHPAFCDVVTGLRWFYTAIQPDKRGFSTSTGIIGHLWRREWATGQGDRDANPLRSTSPHSTRRTQLALEVGPAVSHP